jgi:hypothetical protein
MNEKLMCESWEIVDWTKIVPRYGPGARINNNGNRLIAFSLAHKYNKENYQITQYREYKITAKYSLHSNHKRDKCDMCNKIPLRTDKIFYCEGWVEYNRQMSKGYFPETKGGAGIRNGSGNRRILISCHECHLCLNKLREVHGLKAAKWPILKAKLGLLYANLDLAIIIYNTKLIIPAYIVTQQVIELYINPDIKIIIQKLFFILTIR